MAIQDNLLVVSRAQDCAGSTGDFISTDYIPLGALRDLGNGEPLWLEVEVTTTFSGGTYMRFGVGGSLVLPLDATIDVNLGQTENIPVGRLVAGERFHCAIAPLPQSRYGAAPLVLGELPVALPGIPAGVVPGSGVLYGVNHREGTVDVGAVTCRIVDRPTDVHIYPGSFQAK